MNATPYQLPEAIIAKIEKWRKRYPEENKRSAMTYALKAVQADNHNYLTPPLMDAVAAFLEVPAIAVYEVATFYSMFNLEPVGRHVINVCTNISCMLNGCDKIVTHLKTQLKIDFNETTPDGKITLREAECLAACANAPMLLIGKTYHENLTPEKVDLILDKLE
jgi:NADH-quinone oxidoreductase subunit E